MEVRSLDEFVKASKGSCYTTGSKVVRHSKLIFCLKCYSKVQSNNEYQFEFEVLENAALKCFLCQKKLEEANTKEDILSNFVDVTLC